MTVQVTMKERGLTKQIVVENVTIQRLKALRTLHGSDSVRVILQFIHKEVM